MSFSDDRRARADTTTKRIVEAIIGKDSNALKALFSRVALEKADEIDNDIDVIFRTIGSEILTWENSSVASDEEIRNGKRSEMLRYSFNVVTENGTYHFFVIDYSIDIITPNNQGLYMLEFILYSNNEAVNMIPWQDRMQPGISFLIVE